ncbi:MAG TPA: ATP-binding protein [Thermoanaerobaculia bacterium]|nr:ATP-binding protein [Thermoanaerobaculia bacterium]
MAKAPNTRSDLMRVDGSIQARSTFVAPAELGLRTGETIVVSPESGLGPVKLLALVESATAKDGLNTQSIFGTIQILAAISGEGVIREVTSVPMFFGDVEPISLPAGTEYYGTVTRITDPASKKVVIPTPLEVGVLLTDERIPVVFNACGFNRHTALLAQSGAGKSYALGVIIEELLQKTSARLVIIDPNGDFAGLRELEAGKSVVLAQSRQPMKYRSAVSRLFRRHSRGVLLNLNYLEGVLWDGIVADAISRLWERRDDRCPTIIIVDEAHNFVPALDGSGPVAAMMMKIAAEGRKYGLWLILASQRPQKLHSNVISQCDNLILMKLSSHFDIDHVAGAFGAVDRTLVQLTAGFKAGSGLIVGRLVKSPTLMRFRRRKLVEYGGDIGLDWASRME